MDVETNFLYVDLEEEIYMKLPPGMNKKGDKILVLRKSISELIQTARQWHKNTASILTKIRFTGESVDPCFYMRKKDDGTVYMTSYVNSNLIIGDCKALDHVIAELKENGLVLTVEDNSQIIAHSMFSTKKELRHGLVSHI